jgi:PAS domain S-box-containing protein
MKQAWIIVAITALGVGASWVSWKNQRKGTQEEAQNTLLEASAMACALINADKVAAMTAKGKIPQREFRENLAPLEAFHLSRPDIAHIYTATMVGGEVYTILDTAGAVANSSVHTYGFPTKPLERIPNPDQAMKRALSEGVQTWETSNPKRKTHGADMALYTPLVGKDGQQHGILAITMNKREMQEAANAANIDLVKNLSITAIILAIFIGVATTKNKEARQERSRRLRTEEQFRNMTERMPGAVFIFKSNRKGRGELLFASRGLSDMRGVTAEEATMEWKTMEELLPQEAREQEQNHLTECMETSRIWTCEYQREEKWIQITAAPKNQEGEILWFGTMADVTTRKAEEEKLAKTNAVLQRISKSPNARETVETICQYGASGGKTCIIHVETPEGVRAVAASKIPEGLKEVLAKTREARTDAGPASAACAFTGILEVGSIKDSAFFNKAEDLRQYLLEEGFQSTVVHPIKKEDHNLGLIEFLSREPDDTKENLGDLQTFHLAKAALERIETIRVLEENEKRYRTLFETSPVGICEVSPQNQITFENETFSQLADERLRQQIQEHQSDQRREFHKEGKTFLIEQREIEKADGSRNRITFVYDISDQKMKEEVAVRLREAAEKANEAKSNFLAVMSHEIRTPLNAIVGYAELLEEQKDLSAKAKEQAAIIRVSGENLMGTISEILDFSKIEARKMELEKRSFNIQSTLDTTTKMLERRAAEKGIALRLVTKELPWIIGDSVRIGQIITNLAGNAIKFTKEGSVEIRAEHNGTHLKIEVEDTGIGISEKDQAKLFQPFSQADTSTTRTHGGTGLGLVICKEFCRMMGGRIELESTPDKGTKFTAWIEAPIGTEEVAGQEEEAEDILPINILIAEDEPFNRQLNGDRLHGWGHNCEFATNGREAVERALELKDWMDVIFMDMRMPEMDGIQATKAIRAAGLTQVPIIALTANAMEEDRQRCMEAGMNNYLSKPMNLKALRTALRKLQKAKRAKGGLPPERGAEETDSGEQTTTQAEGQATTGEDTSIKEAETTTQESSGQEGSQTAETPENAVETTGEQTPPEDRKSTMETSPEQTDGQGHENDGKSESTGTAEMENQAPGEPENQQPEKISVNPKKNQPEEPQKPEPMIEEDAWGFGEEEPEIEEGEPKLINPQSIKESLEFLTKSRIKETLEKMRHSWRQSAKTLADPQESREKKREAAHQLKGSTGPFGNQALLWAAKDMERAYKENKDHPMESQIIELVEKTMDEVSKEAEKYGANP